MAQLKKLNFEELKADFEKLMRSIESFVPMGSEERFKRAGVQLEKKSSKKQKIVVPVTEEKVKVVKKEEPIKRTEKGRIKNLGKILRQGDLKTMFDPPLSTDPVWNLPYQQKMLRWRYYDTCRVHCLTLESADIYMLIERRYPIPADVCQAMLDKKLQGDKKDKACYQLHQELASPKQTALAKDFSNPLRADSLPKTVWYGYCKNHKKTVKTGQTRTPEWKECSRTESVLAKGYPMIERIQGQRSNPIGVCEEDLEASSPAINRRLLSLTKEISRSSINIA
ncbi:hypothetical protein Tco_1304632 [Tanacetum coccineum]